MCLLLLLLVSWPQFSAFLISPSSYRWVWRPQVGTSLFLVLLTTVVKSTLLCFLWLNLYFLQIPILHRSSVALGRNSFYLMSDYFFFLLLSIIDWPCCCFFPFLPQSSNNFLYAKKKIRLNPQSLNLMTMWKIQWAKLLIWLFCFCLFNLVVFKKKRLKILSSVSFLLNFGSFVCKLIKKVSQFL